MNKRLTSIFYRSRERGIALILTLAIITLVTLILIAFAINMRVENTASKSFNDVIKARELAQAAVDQAVATIRQATPARSGSPFSTYVTSPGRIYTNGNAGSVTLASPVSSAYAVAIATNNLNAGLWITGTNTFELVAPNPTISVGWVYVDENGSVSSSTAGALTRPLVGRFAYWVDDEASKININTAFQRASSPPDSIGYSTNSEVDLGQLLPNLNTVTYANFIHSFQVPAGPGFATVEEVKLGGAVAGDFDANRFYLTTYSNDANFTNYTDDLDLFDRPRRPLATGANPVSQASDIADMSLNGAYGQLSDPQLENVFTSSGTFQDKYTANGLKQVIANIIAYQENPTSTVPPDGGSSPPAYLGLGRTPYINEVQIKYILTVDTVAQTTNVTRSVSVELFNMYNVGYTAPAGDQITITGLPDVTGTPLWPAGVSALAVAGTAFGGGSYAVFSSPPDTPVQLTAPVQLTSPKVQITYSRGGGRLDYSEMVFPNFTLDPAAVATTPTQYQDAQAGDPCVNDSDGQWEKEAATYAGTLGGPNVWQTSNPPGASSKTYPFGMDMSKAVIRGGAMLSVGELGYIHRPEPFTHVTLQHGGGSSGTQIPDWAMLDIFTVGGGMAGRININGSPTGLTGGSRLVPLEALLYNVVGSPLTIAQNIYNGTYASGSDAFGSTAAYDTIGEVCEVTGVAPNATDSPSVDEADREAAIRRLANIITVRSQEFTIWVVAQSIKQVPTTPTIGTFTPGTDQITGEVRVQAVVERYENQPGTAPQFRVRYFRYLYN